MPELEMREIKSLMAARQEIALTRLMGNIDYQDICHRQSETAKAVEEFYNDRFTTEERITIRRHYEGGIEKSHYETDEVYLQGFRDCFKLVIFFGLLLD
jgi:hypothetical protein